MKIDKYDILYLADKQVKDNHRKFKENPSFETAHELSLSIKRLDDAILFYEGKLKFKDEE